MKKYYFLLLILTALLLSSCSKEYSLESVDSQQNLNNREILKSITFPFFYDEIYEIREGAEIDLTYTQYQTRATHEFYNIAVIYPEFIFPGCVLTGESINKGAYVPVGNRTILKDEISISFSFSENSKIIAPSMYSLKNAIIDATQGKFFKGRKIYKMKEISYYKELKLAFGADVNITRFFNVNVNNNNGKINSNTAMFIDFSDIYFNVNMDLPRDGNIFVNEEIRQNYLSKNPVYVNTVDYGRRGIIFAQSPYSYKELSAAVRTAFRSQIVDGNLSLDDTTKKILDATVVNIYIIGGAKNIITDFDGFYKFIIERNNKDNVGEIGVPIYFSAAYAKDNSMFFTEFDL